MVGCITPKIVIPESEFSTKSKFSYRNLANYQLGNGWASLLYCVCHFLRTPECRKVILGILWEIVQWVPNFL